MGTEKTHHGDAASKQATPTPPLKPSAEVVAKLNAFAGAAQVSIVGLMAEMPPGLEILPLSTVMQVCADIVAAWFPTATDDAWAECVSKSQSRLGLAAVLAPDKLAEWKAGLVAQAVRARLNQDAADRPRLILAGGRGR